MIPQRNTADPAGSGPWEAWMAAAQAGDQRAYAALLREVLPLLRGVARRRIADRAEAEDAVQDTLLTLHRLRHSYDPARPLRPWLVTLCERRCVDRLRIRMRRARHEAPAEAQAEPAAPQEMEQHIACGELRAAIAALPRVQRLALSLAKLQELSLAEAAARAGVSAGALKVATHRALHALRRRLRTAEDALAAPCPRIGPATGR
jgi:RNA polymerase sigma-70 factor, ECF subfamily